MGIHSIGQSKRSLVLRYSEEALVMRVERRVAYATSCMVLWETGVEIPLVYPAKRRR
jgi:hypothetical protein